LFLNKENFHNFHKLRINVFNSNASKDHLDNKDIKNINNLSIITECNDINIIDEETYIRISGKFIEEVTSHYKSSCIQKALKATSPSIITKIFDEVRYFLTVGSKQHSFAVSRPTWKLLLP